MSFIPGMAHVFTRNEVRLIRRLVWLPILLVGAGIVLTAARAWTGAAYGVGTKVEQPIPFSHEQHVDEVGLGCRHCHAAAYEVASGGIPENTVCLECHETLFRGTPALQPLYQAERAGRQVAWKAVSTVPDFVHFHHGAHAEAGVECAACHGDVASMAEVEKAKSLTMNFCIDCHREVQSTAGRTGLRLISAWHRDLTDCSVCHY